MSVNARLTLARFEEKLETLAESQYDSEVWQTEWVEGYKQSAVAGILHQIEGRYGESVLVDILRAVGIDPVYSND